MPKKLKILVAGRKIIFDISRDGRVDSDKKEIVKARSNHKKYCDRRKN